MEVTAIVLPLLPRKTAQGRSYANRSLEWTGASIDAAEIVDGRSKLFLSRASLRRSDDWTRTLIFRRNAYVPAR
jgi:adenylate kinase family enzyme